MVLSTTSGCPSKPRAVPVEKVHATLRFLTLSAVICARGLYRQPCALRPGRGHEPGAGAPGASVPDPTGGAFPVAAMAIGASWPRHAAMDAMIIMIAIHEPTSRLPCVCISFLPYSPTLARHLTGIACEAGDQGSSAARFRITCSAFD